MITVIPAYTSKKWPQEDLHSECKARRGEVLYIDIFS